MNKHVIFILDRSGSMELIKVDAIGGFNQYVKDLRANDPDATFQLVLFDTQSIDVPPATKCRDIVDLTAKTYVPRAGTPLLDAVGKVISESQDNSDTAYLVVTLTDGQENSSHEWRLETLKTLIEKKQATGRWTFAYLGSNQDAWAEGGGMGYNAGSTVTIGAGGQSAAHAFATASAATMNWSAGVDMGLTARDSFFANVTCADCNQVIPSNATHLCPKSGRIGEGVTFAPIKTP